MLRQLTAFELKFHTRQVGFWITVTIMTLIGIAIISFPDINFSTSTGEKIKANGAVVIAGITASASLAAIFFGAIFVVSGVMRDDVYKSLELVHSTPVSTFDMTLSRMLGVYITTFLCIFALSVGLFAGQFMPWMDKEALGPINPLYFLYPALVFIAVNTLLVSGFFTFIAAVTRNRALVYVSAVGLFIAYILAGLFVGQDAPDLLTSLADPFGSSAMGVVTEFWPADEQNTRLIPLIGYIGLNRLVWGLVGLVLFVASFGLFKRGLVAGKSKKFHEDDGASAGPIVITPVTPDMAFLSTFGAFWARFKYEYLTTVKSIPFIILSLMAITLFGVTVYFQMKFLPDPSLPTSPLIMSTVFGSFAIPLLIMVVFFSGEIAWRDKAAGITEILDSSAVKNAPLMAAKWLALWAMVITLLLIGMLFGMAAQAILGDIPINILTYLNMTFVSFAPRILLFCTLVLFIQNFMPNRVIGMLASGGAVLFLFLGLSFLPFTHPLMEFGRMPTGGWSEMNGFSSLIRFYWFGLYWGSLAALFVVLSAWLWRRGVDDTLPTRLGSLRKRISLPSAALALVFAGSFVGTGAYIYKAYNIDNDFQTDKQQDLEQVAWEKLLADDLKKPIPKIRKVDVNAMFNPAQGTATFKGTYIIENTTGSPLNEVYISTTSDGEKAIKKLDLAGATRVTNGEKIKKIEDYGLRLYRFDTPLAPGATTTLRFETFMRASTLGDLQPVERNGTFIDNFRALPQLGMRDARLTNNDKRRKYGLPEHEKRPDRTDMKARQNNFFGANADYVDFTATVCTDKGQIPIAPGKKLREYEKNGKACRDYKSIRPIANFFAFLSADYEVKRSTWENPNGKDIPLAIYYHKTHDYNVALMMDAMKAALGTYTETFGPYQYNQIRIMEFPYRSFAQSFAGTIPFSERIGFVKDPGDPTDNKNVDLASYVVMHEIGHQWFGHQIMPANTKGFNVLSEGLTENAAMTAYEAKFGWQKARRVLEQRAIQQYLTARTIDREDEPPLARAEGQQYLDYNKASWVFWGLKQYMGEDKMQGAIRAFLQEYGYKGPPYPTTMQLVDALRAAAGPQWQGLITDYWDRIVFWDLKFDGDVKTRENKDGTFTVDLTAMVDKKIASEETGKETSVTKIDGESLNEWVEIGFYDKDPKDTLGDKWMKLERVHITDLKTPLSFTLDKRPAYILLDPRRLLIERNVEDNVKKL